MLTLVIDTPVFSSIGTYEEFDEALIALGNFVESRWKEVGVSFGFTYIGSVADSIDIFFDILCALGYSAVVFDDGGKPVAGWGLGWAIGDHHD